MHVFLGRHPMFANLIGVRKAGFLNWFMDGLQCITKPSNIQNNFWFKVKLTNDMNKQNQKSPGENFAIIFAQVSINTIFFNLISLFTTLLLWAFAERVTPI